MNEYQMMYLANDRVAERRAEADRSRLARMGHSETTPSRHATRTRQPRRAGVSLGALFHRVALF